MDMWKEFKVFAKERGMRAGAALGRIAAIRSYRDKEMRPAKRAVTLSRSVYYERYLQRLPCVGCSGTYLVEAQPLHDDGTLGVIADCSSYSCIPLCRKCAKIEVVRDQIQFRYRDLQYTLLTLYLRCVEST